MDGITQLTLIEIASLIESFATSIAALFAIIGAVMVFVQIRASRAIQNESTAKTLFREYLKEALERPDFITPDLVRLELEGRLVQYQLFVGHMMFSLDEALAYTQSPEWRDVVRAQIAPHTAYFLSPQFQGQRSNYSPTMIALIDEACGGQRLAEAA